MASLIQPHASAKLIPLLLSNNDMLEEQKHASQLTKVPLSSREVGDLIMLGIGGFTPLTGFMLQQDWEQVCRSMYLSDGTFWPIPITLSTSKDIANSIAVNQDVALINPKTDEIMATMTVMEKYSIDKSFECQSVFKTTDISHPGVKMVMQQEEVNLAGPVKVLSQGTFPSKYPNIYLTPEETRSIFKTKGWQTIAAFQTRNPMHRSHEFLAKIALEICDGVLIHSLLGQLKPGDIPAEIRQRAIATLIQNYFVADTVIQAGYPLDMRYAGPREALLHALFRQNYGCTHLIVGRDHAGVGDFYGPFEAQEIFSEISDDALLIKALKIDWTFWCNRCDGMASTKTCPHDAKDRVLISGTELRRMLKEHEPISPHFSRPEVVAVLREFYR